jgi:ribosomal protein S18 acetylase RimI-like enzyme
MSVSYSLSKTTDELRGILDLQQRNLKSKLSSDEIAKEGFVTLQHDMHILKSMNDACPHHIAKDGERIVGYALSMQKEFREDIELLRPMFQKIDVLAPNVNYITMGQICIDKEYRGQGIFRGLYQFMQSQLNTKFDVLITEVSKHNLRSLNAHKAVGFENLSYENHPEMLDEWVIVAWNWK